MRQDQTREIDSAAELRPKTMADRDEKSWKGGPSEKPRESTGGRGRGGDEEELSRCCRSSARLLLVERHLDPPTGRRSEAKRRAGESPAAVGLLAGRAVANPLALARKDSPLVRCAPTNAIQFARQIRSHRIGHPPIASRWVALQSNPGQRRIRR